MDRVRFRGVTKNKTVRLSLWLVGVFMSLTVIAVPTYASLTNTSPNPSDVSSGSIDGGMSHMLKSETAALIPKLQVGVYYVDKPAGGDFSTQKIKIRYGADGMKCYQKNLDTSPNPNKYVSIKIEPDDSVT